MKIIFPRWLMKDVYFGNNKRSFLYFLSDAFKRSVHIKFLFTTGLIFVFSITSLSQSLISNSAMFTCFSQGWSGSYATNCASVSVIKLSIARYGPFNVFLNVDSLSDKYVISLRNGHTVELTKGELAMMQAFDKFHFKMTTDTIKAAKFMYAVMAKNKMILHPGQYNSITDAATQQGGWVLHHYTVYELAEDTYTNFELLGIDTSKIQEINVNDIQSFKDIIITNSKHSAYSSFGLYDEYGMPTPNENFGSHHGNHPINNKYNYILID